MLITLTLSSCKQMDVVPPNSAITKLIGTWKSNKELTNKFNHEKSRLTEKQIKFLEQIMGRLVIEYDRDGMAISSMPEYELNMNGNKVKMESNMEVEPYKIIAFDEEYLIMETQSEWLGKHIYRITFENDNTYWIYLGDGGFSLHAREYFTRIKNREETVGDQ